MRVIIYTGKGGVGKTSVAAATGVRLARQNIKTLVVSADLAHSLSDSFDLSLDSTPTCIEENLYGLELNPQSQLEEKWEVIYHYLVDYFKILGLKDIFAEELTLFPGVEELFSLLEIYQHYQEKSFDVLVLDCPPTASTLRLLSFFDAVGWFMDRLFNLKRKSIKFLRNFTDTVMGMPLPEDDFFAAIEKVYDLMAETRKILTNPELTTVRLVMTPEQMVINETQRAYTYLSLYGFIVDAVIVNKVLPSRLQSEFYSEWQERQDKNLRTIEDLFSPLEVFRLPMLSRELRGLSSLRQVSASLYSSRNSLDVFNRMVPLQLEKTGDGYHYQVYIPFLEKEQFDLHQKGVLLIIKAGTYKRRLQLPQVLSNKEIKKASYREGFLHLYF